MVLAGPAVLQVTGLDRFLPEHVDQQPFSFIKLTHRLPETGQCHIRPMVLAGPAFFQIAPFLLDNLL